MEAIGTLGFEPGLFAAQVINFLVLFVIFRLLLFKPILKLLADRKARIAKGIEDADAAKAALERAAMDRDAMIGQAVEESGKIMEETRKAAESMRAQILNQTSREAERITAEAREAAAAELERVREQTREMTIEMSRLVLEKVLPDLFTDAERDIIMERNMNRLEQYDFRK